VDGVLTLVDAISVISARGSSGRDNCCGGIDGGAGSGGSIFVTCASIAGVGSINASGGIAGTDGQNGGGGGGGRIVLVTCAPGSISQSVAAGAGGSGGAQLGTIAGGTSVYLAKQPSTLPQVLECDSNAQFTVLAFGTSTGLTYQWQMRPLTAPFVWSNVSNSGTGSLSGVTFTGGNTATLTLTPTTDFNPSHERVFRCRVTGCDPLSPVLTDEVAILDVIGCCAADLADGAGNAGRDGAVEINDLLYFINQFELGLPGADLDDDGDPGVGNPDGAVTIDDLIFFLIHFEAGC